MTAAGFDVDLAELEALGYAGPLETPPPAPSSSSSSSGTQRVTLTLETGETWDATLDARDRRAYALFADRYQLPAFTLDPTTGAVDVLRLELLTVFSAWHATRYRYRLHALDWPAFNAQLVDLTVHGAAPGVAPHPPVLGGG